MKKSSCLIAISLLIFLFSACSKEALYIEDALKGPIELKSEDGLHKQNEINVKIKKGQILLKETREQSVPVSHFPNVSEINKNINIAESEPTHFYVRFLPKNNYEYDTLLKLNYNISPIPLNSEISVYGTYYHDESISDIKGYSWQYTYIPINEVFPPVQYEILDEISLKEELVEDGRNIFTSEQWQAYEDLKNTQIKTISDIGSSSQEVTYFFFKSYDDLLKDYVPIPFIRVTLVSKFYGTFVRTSSGGSGRISIPVHLIRAGSFSFQLEFLDPVYKKWHIVDKYRQPVVVTFSEQPLGNDVFKFNDTFVNHISAIQRAAYRMFYKDTNEYGFRPESGDMSIKICYLDVWKPGEPKGLYYGNKYNLTENSEIIYVWGCNSRFYTSDDVFSTTAHELGHHVHCVKASKPVFNRTEKILIESWGRFMQQYLTEKEYKELGGFEISKYETLNPSGYDDPLTTAGTWRKYLIPDDYNFQDWPFFNYGDVNYNENKRFLAYSPLFIDLKDANNQSLYYKVKTPNHYKCYPNDDIVGYNINDLLDILSISTDLSSLKWCLKSLPHSEKHGNTHVKIDSLFNRYEHYWGLLKNDPVVQGKK